MSDRTATRPQDTDAPQRLERGVLSVPNGIALAAAAMAPVLAVVLNAPAAGPVAGAALPLSFLIAFVACLFVGNTVVQFSRRLPSAGSFYTFNTAGLGPAAGFFTGWLFWIGYAVLAPGLFCAFGAFVHDYVLSTFDADVPWWIFSLAAMAIVFGLSARSIKASVNIDLTLLALEVVIFLILAVAAIAFAGAEHNTAVTTSHVGVPTGFTGVGLGVVFGILSFIGFDAAATLGEETRNPRRNVPLAVAGALGFVGVFYVIVMYALTAGYGLNDDTTTSPRSSRTPNPFVTLGQKSDAVAAPADRDCRDRRDLQLLPRDPQHDRPGHVLDGPRPRAATQPRPTCTRAWFSPLRAIVAQTVFTVVVGLAVGAWLGPGATGAVRLHRRDRHRRHRPGLPRQQRGADPLLLAHAGAQRDSTHVVAAGARRARPGSTRCTPWAQPGQSYPYNLVPYVVLVWLILGIGLFLYYRSTSPAKIAALGSFVAEDDLPLEEQPEALLTARTPSVQHPTHRGRAGRHPEAARDER